MKRHSSAASLALAVLALFGLAGPMPAGEQVPFYGSFEGDVAVTALNPPFVSELMEATDEPTHLGEG